MIVLVDQFARMKCVKLLAPDSFHPCEWSKLGTYLFTTASITFFHLGQQEFTRLPCQFWCFTADQAQPSLKRCSILFRLSLFKTLQILSYPTSIQQNISATDILREYQEGIDRPNKR